MKAWKDIAIGVGVIGVLWLMFVVAGLVIAHVMQGIVRP